MITHERQLAAVAKLVERCQDEGFWGDVLLTFRGGELKTTTRKETIPTEKLVELIAIPRVQQVDGKQTPSQTEDAKAASG